MEFPEAQIAPGSDYTCLNPFAFIYLDGDGLLVIESRGEASRSSLVLVSRLEADRMEHTYGFSETGVSNCAGSSC
jgi:hypothetical protein